MEGLEFYDEERMLDEMSQALNYEYDQPSIDDPVNSFNFEGELSHSDLKSLKSNYQELTVEDFKELTIGTFFDEIQYKGWTKFFGRFIKLHLIISGKFYTFCVVSFTYLPNNYNMIKRNELIILRYLGIRKNYKGVEYPFLSTSFKLPKN